MESFLVLKSRKNLTNSINYFQLNIQIPGFFQFPFKNEIYHRLCILYRGPKEGERDANFTGKRGER